MSILSSAPGLMVDSKVLQYHQKERGRQSFDSDAWQTSTYFNRNSPTLAARCVPFFKRYLLVICHIAAENGLFSFMFCLLKRVFFHVFFHNYLEIPEGISGCAQDHEILEPSDVRLPGCGLRIGQLLSSIFRAIFGRVNLRHMASHDIIHVITPMLTFDNWDATWKYPI